jgi:hypothetical protein
VTLSGGVNVMAIKNYQHRQTPDTVEAALDCFWVDKTIVGNVPDYSGFMAWVAEKEDEVKPEAVLPLHATLPSSPMLELPLQLLRAAQSLGIEFTREGARPIPSLFGRSHGKKLTVKSFNRGKLLLSYFERASPRSREMFYTMSVVSDNSQSQPVVDQKASQSDHRRAFFRAVGSGDGNTAFKMLGRLREEKHDIGELEFLEATASFHSCRLEDAIRHAGSVPSGSIDWPRARMLILEAHALMGDISALELDTQEPLDFQLPQYFLAFVCQLAVANSSIPEEALQRVLDLTAKVDVSRAGAGAFEMWNRHSCELAVQFVECHRDLTLSHRAKDQGGQIAEHDIEDIPRPLRIRQVECALALDVDLMERVSTSSRDEACQEIVRRLINYGRPDREEVLQALVTQRRIGDGAVFVDNVLRNLVILSKSNEFDCWQTIMWGYEEALILERQSDAALLRKEITESPFAHKLTEIELSSSSMMLDRKLSPMGRIAMRSANWDLSQASKEANPWRDAGMISLGFFRILELEFNERLIAPMLETLNLEVLDSEISALISAKPSGPSKKAFEFWKKMEVSLRRAKESRKGLELGALELVLAKISQAIGSDINIKSLLRSSLLPALSTEGIEALNSGELARLLDGSAREKFRNPPAHSRYLHLSTARECKAYVEIALNRLVSFTPDRGQQHSEK